jgi:hypothetical protein
LGMSAESPHAPAHWLDSPNAPYEDTQVLVPEAFSFRCMYASVSLEGS